MKIRETTEKADNLIEQGEQAKQNQMRAQQNAMSARSQLHAAYAQLDAASETDEDGEPMGDVAGARAAIYAAQAMLQSAESDLANATRQIDAVNREKQETIAEIERYNEAEGRNVSVLQQLQSKRFGGNAVSFAQDILARMNSGEDARRKLLQSLGISAPTQIHTMGGVTGQDGANHNGHPSATADATQSVVGFVVQSIKNPYSTDVKQWTSRLSALSTRLYQQYSAKYGKYISDEKLRKPLSETVTYETQALFTARGLEDGVLGYNDGFRSRVAVGTGHELQTTVHENLHQLSANRNKHGIIERDSSGYRKNVQINEAITELLTQRTLGAEYGPDYSAYSDNRDSLALIESIMGEDTIAEAYFQNKPELMRDKFEEVMGCGSWNELSEAFDDCVSEFPFTRDIGRVRRNNLVNEYMLKSSQNKGGEQSWTEFLF